MACAFDPSPESVLALQAAVGNRAVMRVIASERRLARDDKKSRDGWVIHPEAQKFLEDKLNALYEAIPRRDRIDLKARGTVAIGMAEVDGDVRLVYTVNQNGGSKGFHAAAEKLDLHRWVYKSGVEGRGQVGAPNDAEQLMVGFAKDNHARLDAMVVSRRLCADCSTVLSGYGGGRFRVVQVPDTADLPNPYNPPSRPGPPARTSHGTADPQPAASPAKLPPPSPGKISVEDPALRGQVTKGKQTEHTPSGAVTHGNINAPASPTPAPAQAPPGGSKAPTAPTKATATPSTEPVAPDTPPTDEHVAEPTAHPPKSSVLSALVPAGMMGAGFLAGLLMGWYQNKRFEEEWEDQMRGVDWWLRLFLPSLRFQHRPGTQLYAVIDIDIDTSDAYMGEPGWGSNAPGIKLHDIQVTESSVPSRKWVADKSGWWTRLLGFSYETTRVEFSFPLPKE